jgi:hypothetical protein
MPETKFTETEHPRRTNGQFATKPPLPQGEREVLPLKPKKAPRLGSSQMSALKDMLDQKRGWNEYGLSQKWAASTYFSVMNAVHRHNQGLCGDDCPIPNNQVLVRAALGPKGGRRWVAVDRDPEEPSND